MGCLYPLPPTQKYIEETMKKYSKIQTVYKRDPKTNRKTLIKGDYSLPSFEYLANNQWEFTEKIDGTNVRVIFDGNDDLDYKGKTDNAQLSVKLLRQLRNIFEPKMELLQNLFGYPVCFYGEGYGAGIQKAGSQYLDHQDFVLFDMWIGGFWLERASVEDIAEQLNLKVVPVIGKGTLKDMVEMAQKGFKSQWGDFLAEGIVARPSIQLLNRDGSRIITKIKHKDFPR